MVIHTTARLNLSPRPRELDLLMEQPLLASSVLLGALIPRLQEDQPCDHISVEIWDRKPQTDDKHRQLADAGH